MENTGKQQDGNDYMADLEKIDRIANWECVGDWSTRKDPSDGSDRYVIFLRPNLECVQIDIGGYKEGLILAEIDAREVPPGYPFPEQPWKQYKGALNLVLEKLRSYRGDYMFSSYFRAEGFDADQPEPSGDEIQMLEDSCPFEPKILNGAKETTVSIALENPIRPFAKLDVAAISAVTLCVFNSRSFIVFNRHGTSSTIAFGYTDHQQAAKVYNDLVISIERIRGL